MKRYIKSSEADSVMLLQTDKIEEDSYTNYLFNIVVNGKTVGDCSVLVDKNYAYCERIDINKDQRNQGFGTNALYKLADMFGDIVVAPDNEDAKRLYERIVCEYNGNDADYIDQGYGVYRI